ncbi:hypothetical protein MSPP1_003553 [Malassezia sp. CBS 17886]|nr:hypothetical protein MSPP1_003553 [Malassezia sp. CBS 17886]
MRCVWTGIQGMRKAQSVRTTAAREDMHKAQSLRMPEKTVNEFLSAPLDELRAHIGVPLDAAATAGSAARATSPETLTDCPFCHEALAQPISRTLRGMIRHWQRRERAGLALRPTDTLAVCQRHRDEHDVIPRGRARGWPAHVSFKELRRRVTDPKERYLTVLEDRILYPEHSRWFTEHRAHYGEIGWELLTDVLQSAYIQDPLIPSLDLRERSVLQRIHPLDAASFLDRVLLPELVCMLIQDDMGGEAKATYEQARAVQRESRKFGVAMYAGDTGGAARETKRSSAWIGASPKRVRTALSPASPTSPEPKCAGALVQQTLPGVRRSARLGGENMPGGTDTDAAKDTAVMDSGTPPPRTSTSWHQQRLAVAHVPLARTSRPSPRAMHRKSL